MSIFARLGAGVTCGLICHPFLSTRTNYFESNNMLACCESVSEGAPNVTSNKNDSKAENSDKGLFRYFIASKPVDTKELEYDKTWGVPWVEDWDRPHLRWFGKADGNATSRKKRRILMIRHGQYENESSSHDDNIRTLTPLGVQQAQRTGEYLREAFELIDERTSIQRERRAAQAALAEAEAEFVNKGVNNTELFQELNDKIEELKIKEKSIGELVLTREPNYVYVSDMTRARQTAENILSAFPKHIRKKRLIVDPKLREIFPCDPEPYYKHKRANPLDMKIAEEVFQKYFYRPNSNSSNSGGGSEDYETDIIVGHGNLIRYLTLRALQLPPEAWLRTTLPHCSITSITISEDGRVHLIGWGSYGHLTPRMTTVHNIK